MNITLPSGVTLREFYDPKGIRQSIFDRVHQEFKTKFPMVNDRVRLELLDSGYDPKKSHYSLDQYQDALLKGGRLSTPLRGKVRLVDKSTNQPLDERDVTLANVPYMTDDGTFVYGGSHYAVSNQSRLRAGIYHRRKDSGEYEAHVNVKPGTGVGMRLFMEPSTGVFRASIGQSSIKLYPVLKGIGVSDQDLEKSWGKDILAANVKAFDRRAFDKFYGKLLDRKANPEATPEEKAQSIRDVVGKMELDPEVNSRTLNKPHAFLSPEALIDSTSKLLKINRGEEKQDDRDHPANRSFHSVDDFLSDRVKKDAGGLARQLLYKTTYDRTLKSLHPGYFTPQLETLIVGNSLSSPISGINPVEVFDQQRRVVQTGEGAVSSQEAIPLSARNVQAAQLGLLDPIRSAESGSIGVDQRFAVGALKGSDNQIYQPLRNKKTGEIEYLNPSQLHGKTVAFPKSVSLEPYKTMSLNLPTSDLKTASFEELAEIEMRSPILDLLEFKSASVAVDLDGTLAFAPEGKYIPTVGKPIPKMMKKVKDWIAQGEKVVIFTARAADKSNIPIVKKWLKRNGLPALEVTNEKVPSMREFHDDLATGYKRNTGTPKSAADLFEGPSKPRPIAAVRDGKMQLVHPHEVDYEIPGQHNMFCDTTNAVPIVSSMKGARTFIASKYSVTKDTKVLVHRLSGETFWGAIEDYRWELGDRGLSVDQKTHEVIWREIKGVSSHLFDEELYKLTLFSGREITGTKHHSFVTMGDEGELKEVYPENLSKYSPIPRARSFETEIKTTEFKIPAGDKHNARAAATIPLDYDFGWFIGLYLAEGSINVPKNRRIDRFGKPMVSHLYIAACDPDVRSRVENFFCKIGVNVSHPFNKHHGKIIGTSIHWKQLCLRIIEEFETGSFKKRIPGWAFFTSREFREGIVAGYLSGDGTVTSNTTNGGSIVVGSSRSKELIEGLMTLLTSLSIDSFWGKSMVVGKPQYRFRVAAEDIVKLPKLNHTNKDIKLATLTSWRGERTLDWIPDYKSLHQEILCRSKRGDIHRGRLGQNQLTFEKVREVFGDETKSICPWVDSNVRWDYIKKIEKLPPTSNLVYDIHMDGNVFAAGLGIFVHNSNQSLPLINPEAPLVDSMDMDTGEAYAKTLGHKLGIKKSEVDGKVHEVGEKFIDVVDDSGKIHRHELKRYFPHNRKTYENHHPSVQEGDQVRAGDMIAHGDYVDKHGHLSTGKNLNVAFIPAPNGASFEDAIQVSETTAKKLTSKHMYGFDVEHKQGVESNKKKFISLFPNKYTNDQLAKIGENGMVKADATLEPGDPIFLSFSPRTLSNKDMALGNLHKVLRNSFEDHSQQWEKHTPGTVAHAVETRNGLSVNMVTHRPLAPGDKISGRSGAKGVVSSIIPDHKMIRNEKGEAVDIIINPAAMIGRVNPTMAFEAVLGKIAHEHGKKYVLPSFGLESFRDFTEHELKAHNMKDREDLFDPVSGRKVPNALTGRQYFMKLEHMAEDKASGRGDGGYDLNGQPTKGGSEGAKRMGGLLNTALLSHGATGVLQDAHIYRGTNNEDAMKKIRLGQPLPPPKVPFIYDKFIASLKAAGINIKKSGSKVNLMAMTDKDVDQLAPKELQNAETLDPKTGEPVAGGLMDFAIHGGPEGNQFSHIKLDHPIPNPVMEDPVRRLLGLTQNGFRDVISGKSFIGGKTGPEAFKQALAGIDLDKQEEEARETIRNGRKTKRNDAVKKLNFIVGLKKAGISPSELMMSKVPVLPPNYRPILKLDNMMLSADANYLYKDLHQARAAHRMNQAHLGESDLGEERLAIYDAVKAIQGLGEPINPESEAKGIKGFIKSIAGVGGPKCYDDDTEVLTENGWIPFPEYKDSSVKVATLNPKTHVMEFQNPTYILHEHYEGNMVHTNTSKLDLFVTEGHWHYVETCIKRAAGKNPDGTTKRLREWQAPGKIQAGDLTGKNQRVRYITAADNFYGETPEYTFGGITVNKEAFSELVGWYISEGCLTWRKDGVSISQKDGTDGTSRIDDMMSRLGLKFYRNLHIQKTEGKKLPVGYRSVDWVIYNKDLVKWILSNCGNGSENMMLSPEILSWEKEHQHILLEAYLAGDGEVGDRVARNGKRKTYFNMSSVIDKRSRASTTSKRLMDDIERLCIQTGLGFKFTDNFHEDHEIWKKQYRFRIYGYNRVVTEYRKQTVKIENWKGMVHCVTVPNGLIFVKRNECVSVSGNTGMLMAKVLGHPVNAVGRGVIVPDADLNMDEVGIPEELAWKSYDVHTMRNMVRDGMPAVQAAKHIEERTDHAKKYLIQEMERRPVMVSRDPALHRFSIMGAYPKLRSDSNIAMSPLVVKPFGADHDGDQMNFHVPMSDAAVADVKNKMMPSQNLFDLKAKSVHYLPSQEFVLGLSNATSPHGSKKVERFTSREEAIKAYHDHRIDIDTPIEIVNLAA